MTKQPQGTSYVDEILDDYFRNLPFVTLGNRWEDELRKDLHASITSLIEREKTLSRIDELEDFQWNDAHRHVHTRLATLREALTLGQEES